MPEYKNGEPRDLPILLRMLLTAKDYTAVEDLLQKNIIKMKGNISLSGLMNVLKLWPSIPTQERNRPVLRSFRSAVIRESVSVSQRQALTTSQLKVLVDAAKGNDLKALGRLTDVAASPPLLKFVQAISADSSWKKVQSEIAGVLNPFIGARVEVPRLQSTCAVFMLRLLKKVSTPSSVCLCAAVLLEFRPASLVAMPAFVDVFASHISRCSLPSASTTGIESARKMCRRLVLITEKAVPQDSGDKIFDGWVDCLERIAQEKSLDIQKASAAYRWLEQTLAKELGNAPRDELGPDWLGVLLVRSRRLLWHGDQDVQCVLPDPGVSVRALAQAFETQDDNTQQPSEPEPDEDQERPTKIARTLPSDETAKEVDILEVRVGEDREMGETLAGSYIASGTNHGRTVYTRSTEGEKALLFYWDERDGEDQLGWWFGPEVGGEEVWAHVWQKSEVPPEHGWTMLHSGILDPLFAVVKACKDDDEPGKQTQDAGSGRGILWNWLNGLDEGSGQLLCYYDALVSEFDSDLAQIAAAKVEGEHIDVLDYVDPSFWETLSVEDNSHKLLFARGIQKL